MKARAALLSLVLAGCQSAPVGGEPDPVAPPSAKPVSEPEPSAAPELFGAPFASDVPEVALGQLLADPEAYAGKIVETRGKVSQVCQAAGCWMELSAAGEGASVHERVRTPMAGHAFFVPKTIVGKQARVQGRVELVALSEPMKKHLEAEGAQATGSALSISALSVAVQ